MFLIRNVFRCKPGQAKKLAQMFKATIPTMEAAGAMKGARVMTDTVSTFWTVVMEAEAESLEAWERSFEMMASKPEMRKAMEGYMDLVEGGHREIFHIE
jgi:hypothetical protein